MKKLISFFAVILISTSAFSADSADRRSNAAQWSGASRTTTVSKNQISGVVRASTTADAATTVAEEIAAEKEACTSNNVGTNNTFVWASKDSDTSNYSSMVEDTENPENNTCFVRVALNSSDSKIDVSDIDAVYYEMGNTITCGSWADRGKIEDRILDAKKSARTWGTVAGAVGGAGVGVGAMELFGNKLIGGKVEGQKGIEQNELLKSQLLVLKEKDEKQYEKFRGYLQNLKIECENKIWSAAGAPEKPTECNDIKYDTLLAI